MNRYSGKILWFSVIKGYGFIEWNYNQKIFQIFLHEDQCDSDLPHPGQKIEFSICLNDDCKLQALNAILI